MFLLAGWQKKFRPLDDLGVLHCANCDQRAPHRRFVRKTAVNLYGIPVGEFGDKQFSVCGHCNWMDEFDPEKEGDRWHRLLRDPKRGPRLREAALTARERGMSDFVARYGPDAVIDLEFLVTNRAEIRRLFNDRLVEYLADPAFGFQPDEIRFHAARLTDIVENELAVLVEENGDP